MIVGLGQLTFEQWMKVGDLLIKAVGALLVILGGLASFRQYRRQKLFEKELELYARASEAASRIANAAKQQKKDEAAEKEFWDLYWGPLCIVESPKVEEAMVLFGTALETGEEAYELRSLSYALAHAAREAMEHRFSIDLGKLTGGRIAH